MTDAAANSRPDRDWALVCTEADELTARLVCTYLEAEYIEARVVARVGRFCVEVPFEQYEAAMRVYAAGAEDDPDAAPMLQEVSRATTIKTARHMRQALARRGVELQAPGEPPRRAGHVWLLLAAAALLAAALFVVLLLRK